MEQDKIVEGNRLIMFYHGAQQTKISILGKQASAILYAGSYFPLDKPVAFDKDWNLLITVVDDIYYSRRFNTGVQSGEISSKPVRLYANIKAGLLNLSKTQTWKAIVAFIEWYNSVQKVQGSVATEAEQKTNAD